jgi:hypothetical protein
MDNSTSKKPPADEKDSQLLSRKKIVGYLGISPVTLTNWMKRAFPFIKSMAGSTSSAPRYLNVKSHRQRKTGI